MKMPSDAPTTGQCAWFGLAAVAMIGLAPLSAKAEEGMWTFENFPTARAQADLGWAPDAGWLQRVQSSAVRLSSGCSASFVSGSGLVLTNWHCVSDCVASLSSARNDLAAKGFLARTLAEEKTCPGVSGDVLLSTADVTARVNAALDGVSPAERATARANVISAIEEEACTGKDNQKYRCDVVSLYRGGRYSLYTYRTYKDMRLSFAPETAAGFFGGDPDNFNFPRFALDAAFLRAWEDGRPVTPVTHLPWSTTVPAQGDPVLVAGNPGSTQRLLTVRQLAFTRDWLLPTRQLVRSELRGMIAQYRSLGREQRRSGEAASFGIENSWKAQNGQMRALMDPEFFAIKQREEADLRARVAADPELAAEIGDPWADIEAILVRQQALFYRHDFLEARAGSISELYGVARQIVRMAAEAEKPAAQRIPGYSDTAMRSARTRLLEVTPVYRDLERIGLTLWLTKAQEYLGADDPAVRTLLGNVSAVEQATRLATGTRLNEARVRRALLDGGQAAVLASTDPMIRFVLANDAAAREIAAQWRREVVGPTDAAAQKIATARFRVYGDALYPDATFTLRLSYGRAMGWSAQGQDVPYVTTIGGLFQRATGAYPFNLAPSWASARGRLDPVTPFNIVSTNDIIGGNSGSPLINRNGEVVGAVFDGNIHSLGGDFAYDGRTNRSVSVTTAAITEALRHVYGADHLVTELAAR
ncbi:MAG: S46 family peptidase [Hyphomonadaceae bacterium]|nr:S46 family peptidase [Hyphomonadaceae bacterium]